MQFSAEGAAHNKRTLSKLAAVCLTGIPDQNISQITLRNISIPNGMALMKEMMTILGEEMRLAVEHTGGSEAESTSPAQG